MYEIDRDGLADLMVGEPAYRTKQVWDGLYERALLPSEMTDLPKPLRASLEDRLSPSLVESRRQEADRGSTVKWLWELHDGASIETVLMVYPKRATVCVSTQAGCAMACTFCATGQAGFKRQLTVAEIVEQVQRARREAYPTRISNIVFMGMGEPLANYRSLRRAIDRLHVDIGMSARNLTVSTVGIVPGILKLAEEGLPVTLALSLHAANDDLRNRLVPINKRYPMAELARACGVWVERTRRRLSIEWAMIDQVNDSATDAEELAAFAVPLGAHVNLIPLNPTPGYGTAGSPRDRFRKFHLLLSQLGVNATIRATRGAEIDAACGQLATKEARIT